jgi:hypothetical protein
MQINQAENGMAGPQAEEAWKTSGLSLIASPTLPDSTKQIYQSWRNR